MEKSTQPPIILVRLLNAYYFRQMLEKLKFGMKQFNFRFTPNGFSIQEQGENNQFIFLEFFEKEKLLDYQYNAFEPDSGALYEEYSIGIDLKDLLNACGSITKKMGLIICYDGVISGPPRLTLCPLSEEGGKIGCSDLRIINVPKYQYPSPDFSEPNVKTGAKQFSKIVSTMIKEKCTSMSITCYPKGILFQGYEVSGELRKTEMVGLFDGDEGRGSLIDRMRAISMARNDTYPKTPILPPMTPRIVIIDDIPSISTSTPKVMEKPRYPAITIGKEMLKAFSKIGLVAPEGGIVSISGRFLQDNEGRDCSVFQIIFQIGPYGTSICVVRGKDN